MLYRALIGTLLLLGGVGCASIPLSVEQCNAALSITAMEHEQCLKGAADWQILQDEKEDRRLVKRDELIAYLNACDAAEGLVLVETIKIGRSKLPNNREERRAMEEWGYKYTHSNVSKQARIYDFQCATPRQIMDALRRQGF